jgi:Glycosyl transferase family 90
MEDFSRRKYAFVADGFTAASRLSMALSVGSLVLTPRSRYRQYFEASLIPWVHYVPLWVHNRSDIFTVLGYLQTHQVDASKIAATGKDFACNHLVSSGRACFWRLMAEEYTRHILAYKIDDALVQHRHQQFPEMVQVTTENLICDAASVGGRCRWKEPPAAEHEHRRI